MSFAVPRVLANRVRPAGMSTFAASLTVQGDKDRTDIRNIVKRAMRGASVVVNVRDGKFADISDAPSYMEALNRVAHANELFASLPSSVRDRFSNDPVRLLSFLDNPDNKDEGIKLGLIKPDAPPPAPPEPMLVRVVPDVVPKS